MASDFAKKLEDLHQIRFACAIWADKHVQPLKLHRHILQRQEIVDTHLSEAAFEIAFAHFRSNLFRTVLIPEQAEPRISCSEHIR